MRKKKIKEKSPPREFFTSEKTRPRKSLGQNFIIDPDVLRRIGEIAELSKEDEVLEIGAGLGALTLFLGERAGRVIAIEKDKTLLGKLKQTVSHIKNVEVIFEDALRVDFKKFYRGNKIKVVSNLPYSISSPILLKLLGEREIFSGLVLMVQREVGERITASPGTKQYGSISILVGVYMDASIELHVPPEAFWPQPDVRSAVLKLTPLPGPRIDIPDEKLFERVIRTAFSSRRKMLANSLRPLLPKQKVEEILKASHIDKKRRAETLSLEEFRRLTEEASKML